MGDWGEGEPRIENREREVKLLWEYRGADTDGGQQIELRRLIGAGRYRVRAWTVREKGKERPSSRFEIYITEVEFHLAYEITGG